MSHQSSAAPAAVQNGSAEKKRSCCADLPWETCLRALGGVLGLLVIALGFVSLITGSFSTYGKRQPIVTFVCMLDFLRRETVCACVLLTQCEIYVVQTRRTS